MTIVNVKIIVGIIITSIIPIITKLEEEKEFANDYKIVFYIYTNILIRIWLIFMIAKEYL